MSPHPHLPFPTRSTASLTGPSSTLSGRRPTSAGNATSSAVFGLIAVVLLWGVNFSVVKDALNLVEPLVFNGVRFLLAGAALAALRPGPTRPDRSDVPTLIGLGIVGHTLYQVGFIFGLDGTLAGNAAVILAAAPVWTLVLAVLVGQESWRPSLGAAAVLGLGGIGLVMAGGGGEVALSRDTLRGDLLMAAAAVCWAAYTVAGRRVVLKYGALTVTTWAIWIGGLPIVLAAIPGALTTAWASLPPLVWLQMAYAGLGAIAAAYVLWYRGVQVLGSSTTALWSNLVPCVALLVAWLWLGERPGRLQVLGALVVLVSVGLARWGPGATKPASTSSG